MVSCVYDFRCNVENFVDYEALHTFLDGKAKKWVFQLEKGQTGYEHYQGRMSLIKKTTQAKANSLTEGKFNYLQPTTTKEHTKEAFYVLKEQTRIKPPETDKDYNERKNIFVPKHMKNIKIDTLKPFQLSIYNSVNDCRTINYLYNETGNIGKTTLADFMELNNKGFRCPTVNDFKDIMQLVCNYCKDNEIRDIGHLFLDMPKSQNKDKLTGIYSAIEELKTGRLFDLRNHFKTWRIESPNIWVFSNKPPEFDALSVDRWKIWTVNNDNELVPYIIPQDPIEYGINA